MTNIYGMTDNRRIEFDLAHEDAWRAWTEADMAYREAIAALRS